MDDLLNSGDLIYGNGDRYIGDLKENMKEGRGKLLYQNGDYYEGDWKQNLQDG